MLLLPPGVTRELYEKRQAREQGAAASGVFAKDDRCREYDPLLKRVEPYLSMVFCNEPAPLQAVACGARPGRYNIVRDAPGYPLTFIPLVGEHGEFVEPNSAIFEGLKLMDWWSDDVNRERRRKEQALKDAEAKALAEERREMNEDVLEHYLAATRTQVSMNRDTAWAQNARGYKKVRGKGKK